MSKLPKKQDFNEWYADIVLKAELVDHTDVSGCSIFRPYSFAMWEKIKDFLDAKIKNLGVKNAYFPSLIQEDLLTKEEDHMEGVSVEVAWVTHGGNTKLGKKLAIRPTSEAVISHAFSRWVRSHRDLPMKINQWVNVVRWEFKHPTPFLRNREFLWQEGHTVFASKEEAEQEVQDILNLYERVYEELLAIPVLAGKKSQAEKFPGADETYTLEAFLPNGKSIQGCTSHYLGTSFAKAYDISYLDENGENQFVHQNSWGLSTRTLGALIGVHGDDKGLVLPPNIAPIKTIIVPIVFSNKPEISEEIMKTCTKLANENGWELDDRDHTPGRKFNYWEQKGVPVRVEMGPRDLENENVTVVRRDTGSKEQVSIDKVVEYVENLYETIQLDMLEKQRKIQSKMVVEVKTLKELKNVIDQGKIGKAAWEGTPKQEEKIKDVTGAKSLCGFKEKGTCFMTGKENQEVYIFGKTI